MNIPASNRKRRPILADSMAFLAPQGQLPIFRNERPQLDLAHVTSVSPFTTDFRSVIATHNIFKSDLRKNPNVHFVEIKEDLDTCHTSMGILLGLQCPPIGLTRARVKQLFDEGVRVMGLAYYSPTEYGCGFAYDTDAGLKKEGRDLITWMAEVGMILNISHAHEQTACDALNFITDEIPIPVMASHSGCLQVFPHQRNLPDNVIKRIGKLNGYIGIPMITFLTARNGSNYLDAIVNHIKHVIDLIGSESLGIGSDCPYVDMTMLEASRNFEHMMNMLDTEGRFGEYFPDRPLKIIEHGSQLLEVTRHELEWNKYPGETINRILGDNFIEFLDRSLP